MRIREPVEPSDPLQLYVLASVILPRLRHRGLTETDGFNEREDSTPAGE